MDYSRFLDAVHMIVDRINATSNRHQITNQGQTIVFKTNSQSNMTKSGQYQQKSAWGLIQHLAALQPSIHANGQRGNIKAQVVFTRPGTDSEYFH